MNAATKPAHHRRSIGAIVLRRSVSAIDFSLAHGDKRVQICAFLRAKVSTFYHNMWFLREFEARERRELPGTHSLVGQSSRLDKPSMKRNISLK
jgi:hypothetical protein